MSPESNGTPKEWAEARALLVHRLNEQDKAIKELAEMVYKQREIIFDLRLKIGGLAAVISTAISFISWFLKGE